MSAHEGHRTLISVGRRSRERAHPVAVEAAGIGLITLVAFLLRLWDIGGKGLWYDEAITALMARAGPAEIVAFHWRNAFEHPPLWALFMHAWSSVFGGSEAALRWPAALAGTLLVPLVWQILRLCRPEARPARLLAALFVALSPVLTLYSQEARMYAVVTLLAATSVYLFLRILRHARAVTVVAFVLVNWLMLGFHYYSVLLLVAQALCFLTLRRIEGRKGWAAVALALSVLPLALWAAFSPGFQATLRIVAGQSVRSGVAWRAFGDRFWRELTFGSVVWLPGQSAAGYLLLPLPLVGLSVALRSRSTPAPTPRHSVPKVAGRLWGFVFLLPIAASLAFPNRIFTRYILFVAPVFYMLLALGAVWLWRRWRVIGAGALAAVMTVAVLGLQHYFTAYQKSAYRDLAREVILQTAPGDAILIEGPRQHLLARYYLPPDRLIFPMPDVALPDYFPVTAPPVIPEAVDDSLKELLRQHGRAWLILAGQSEVDPNAFVERFLAAIAFRLTCREELDVRVCSYADPAYYPVVWSSQLDAGFGGELQLTGVKLSYPDAGPDSRRFLLVALNWVAKEKPSVDYKVTLRLRNQQGIMQAQLDSLPMSVLLPPTTWRAGDRVEGHMAIPVPQGTPPGDYELIVGVYDPATLALFDPQASSGRMEGFVSLARVQVDEFGVRSVSESKQ